MYLFCCRSMDGVVKGMRLPDDDRWSALFAMSSYCVDHQRARSFFCMGSYDFDHSLEVER